MTGKPPLPPRAPSFLSTASVANSDSIDGSQSVTGTGSSQYLSPSTSQSPSASLYLRGLGDPRSSSSQSIRPVESAGENRRTLLIIYIHGFLGDETSFKSFPAHVHGLLTSALTATHVVYTKIYPRYKSRKNISFARDAFSAWLAPHESETIDVILVGHSLGGILAAEAILIPLDIDDAPRHRILGLVAFDTPFLGMHPGVVGTGIASLFRTPPQPDLSPIPTDSPFLGSDPASNDPTFNPSYKNDVRLANRKGKLQRAWYFWNKHAGELAKATGDYFASHVEFGGCLADYPGLKRRYNAIRALEDVDDTQEPPTSGGPRRRRVRFVNYYSASTGPVKERSPSPSKETALLEPPSSERRSSEGSLTVVSRGSPRLSLVEHRDGDIVTKDITELNIDDEPPTYPADSTASLQTSDASAPNDDLSSSLGPWTNIQFPPLPGLPEQPIDFDPSQYPDEDVQKLVRKEHEWKVKAYKSAVKDREKFIKEREKLAAKKRRDGRKRRIEDETSPMKYESNLPKTQPISKSSTSSSEEARAATETNKDGDSAKKSKDRKFCALPSKDRITGLRDPTWIRVYMEGIDEVSAHTSMFKMSETYARMVRDVAERIESWVLEDSSTRMVRGEADGEKRKESEIDDPW